MDCLNKTSNFLKSGNVIPFQNLSLNELNENVKRKREVVVAKLQQPGGLAKTVDRSKFYGIYNFLNSDPLIDEEQEKRKSVKKRKATDSNHKTSIKRQCVQLSPLPDHIAVQVKAALASPGFQKRKHTAMDTVMERMKKEAELKPRCKFSRALMNGYDCACCKDHYDAMGLEGEERKKYVNRVSKHRGFQQAPPTPEYYWEVDAPSKEEAIRRGYVIDSNSPLFKKKTKKDWSEVHLKAFQRKL